MELIRIVSAKPGKDYTLALTFSDGKKGIYDVKKHLNKGIFKELQNLSLFKSVRVNFGTVEWANGADLCPDCVYAETKITNSAAEDKKWHE